MANLTLELIINSARILTNVNLITKMDVYGVITIQGEDTQKVKTAVDRSGGSRPTWNHAVKLSVNETLARNGRLTLDMKLICRRVLGNTNIGGVNVPLLELLNSFTPSINGDGNDQEMTFVTYHVKSRSGKRKGSLTFSYRFSAPPSKPDIQAVLNRSSVGTAGFATTSYLPPSKPGYSSASAPPELSTECRQLTQPPFEIDSDDMKHPAAAGSPPYDQSGNTYHHTAPLYFAPPETRPYGSYGSVSLATPPPKGIGLGLGLRAGLLGGLIMGDIVSDVANCYDL